MTTDAHPTPPETASGLLMRYFGALLAALLVLRVAALFVKLAMIVPMPYDFTFPEGALVARAMDVARGETPYHDWRVWPHAFAPYPPLTYYPVGWLARAAGGDLSPMRVYMIGRIFSCVALLGVAVLAYLLGRRLGLSRAWSFAAVGLLAEYNSLMEYCASYRPDAPKTMFVLLALWIASRPRAGWGTVAAALGALLASAWFKPTSWGVGVVLAIWAWRVLGPKRALAAGAAFAAAGVLPILFLDHRWNGRLLLNLVDSLKNGTTLDGYQRVANASLVLPGAVMAAGAMWAVAGLSGRRTGPSAVPGRWVILAAAPATLLVTLIQMFKVGSDQNYFMDSYPLTALAAVWGFARLWRGEARWPAALRGGVIGVVIAVLTASCIVDLRQVRHDYQRMVRFWGAVGVQHMVRQIPGPILASNPFIALTHAEPTIMDYFQYGVLCRRGAIDPGPLLERVRGRRFSAIIISEPILNLNQVRSKDHSELYCRDFLPALNTGYRLKQQVGNFYIFVPRN